jgi:prophage antirepressor-like protein
MSNTNLTSYNFHDSNIRVEQNDKGEVLFCLADVCTTLKLQNPSHAANQIKEEFGCPTLNVAHLKDSLGRDQECTMITEPQLYFVMMRSNSKIAREFRQWICNEVLPSIRANGTYTQKKEQPKKRCWYVEEIKSLSDKNNLSDESFVALVDIANRAFKQGYAIALNKGNPQAHLNTQEQIESGQVRGVLMTESQAVAVDHILYYHQMFRPDLLAIYDQIASLQKQAQDLCFALRDINKARLYEAATAPDFSVDVLLKNKKKNELVTRN